MVAFIIAAMACIVLYRAGFSGVAEDVTAARYQEAVVRAQSHLAALGPLTKLQTQQLSGDDGGGFHWQVSIATGPSVGTLTLYDVQVTERFGDQGGDAGHEAAGSQLMKPSEAGFTLLEMLVALVVFGLVMAGIAQAFRYGFTAISAGKPCHSGAGGSGGHGHGAAHG